MCVRSDVDPGMGRGVLASSNQRSQLASRDGDFRSLGASPIVFKADLQSLVNHKTIHDLASSPV